MWWLGTMHVSDLIYSATHAQHAWKRRTKRRLTLKRDWRRQTPSHVDACPSDHLELDSVEAVGRRHDRTGTTTLIDASFGGMNVRRCRQDWWKNGAPMACELQVDGSTLENDEAPATAENNGLERLRTRKRTCRDWFSPAALTANSPGQSPAYGNGSDYFAHGRDGMKGFM